MESLGSVWWFWVDGKMSRYKSSIYPLWSGEYLTKNTVIFNPWSVVPAGDTDPYFHKSASLAYWCEAHLVSVFSVWLNCSVHSAYARAQKEVREMIHYQTIRLFGFSSPEMRLWFPKFISVPWSFSLIILSVEFDTYLLQWAATTDLQWNPKYILHQHLYGVYY